jgi:branched-chain amino acid transport system ATP-binding protein
MKMVMDISDRVLAINFGQTVTLGTPRQVQQNPDVLKAYIGEENG